MAPLIGLLILLVVLCIVGAAAHYIVKKFELPQFVLMVVGVLLLLALILFVFGGYGNAPVFPMR